MMKKKLASILIVLLLPVLSAAAGLTEDTGIRTLEQAVKAAEALASQSTGASDVLQVNAVALNVASVVIDLDFAHIKYEYLDARQESLKLKAEKADKDFRVGRIDSKTRDKLKKTVVQNNFDLNYYKLQIENCEKSFKSLTGEAISSDFEYDDAYLITDAGKLKLPASADKDMNGADADKKLNEVLTAYKKLGDLISVYIEAGEKLAGVQKEYKTGKADHETVEAAGEDKEKARIDALEGKAQFSKLLYELDCSLQGYISRDVKKIPNPIFLPSPNTIEKGG